MLNDVAAVIQLRRENVSDACGDCNAPFSPTSSRLLTDLTGDMRVGQRLEERDAINQQVISPFAQPAKPAFGYRSCTSRPWQHEPGFAPTK